MMQRLKFQASCAPSPGRGQAPLVTPSVRAGHSSSRVVAAAAAPTPAFEGSLTAKDDRSPRSENVEGAFYVDHTCIDCDTCRLMAPETFSRVGEQSAVHQQPTDAAGRVRALQALFSCPT